jgi:hypothetical protein
MDWLRRTKSCATEQETTMKTENELGSTLSEAELDEAALDEVRGGVELQERIPKERIEERLKGLNAEAFDRLAVMDFSPITPVAPGGVLGRLVRAMAG